MKLNKRIKIAIIIFLSLVIFIFLAVFLINLLICGSANKYIYDSDEIDEIEGDFDCILVLGAGVYSDGSPTPMLSDRLTVAIEAYNKGLSDRILMSGDHLNEDYDEVGAMRRFATENGVDSKVIFLDHAGISTYDSVYRAVNVFGAEKILIITQKYHLYRAVYLAQQMGIEACGISASLREYRGQPVYTVREIAARIKDFAMAIANPEATYMGEAIDLLGDGSITH